VLLVIISGMTDRERTSNLLPVATFVNKSVATPPVDVTGARNADRFDPACVTLQPIGCSANPTGFDDYGRKGILLNSSADSIFP